MPGHDNMEFKDTRVHTILGGRTFKHLKHQRSNNSQTRRLNDSTIQQLQDEPLISQTTKTTNVEVFRVWAMESITHCFKIYGNMCTDLLELMKSSCRKVKPQTPVDSKPGSSRLLTGG